VFWRVIIFACTRIYVCGSPVRGSGVVASTTFNYSTRRFTEVPRSDFRHACFIISASSFPCIPRSKQGRAIGKIEIGWSLGRGISCAHAITVDQLFLLKMWDEKRSVLSEGSREKVEIVNEDEIYEMARIDNTASPCVHTCRCDLAVPSEVKCAMLLCWEILNNPSI
jgi:hypothetical protein